MTTKIGTSFGLALLLALGVIGTMLALGTFSASREGKRAKRSLVNRLTMADTRPFAMMCGEWYLGSPLNAVCMAQGTSL